MKQKIELYNKLREVKNAANKMATDGWFIHTMSMQQYERDNHSTEYLVVYRKES